MQVMVKSLLRPLLPFWIIMTLKPLSFETNLERQDMLFEAFSGYLQFLLAMLTIEMFIILWSMTKKQGIINRRRESLPQELGKLPFNEVVKLTLKKFSLYVCKIIIVSIIYYFVYVIIFIVVSSVYSIYIQQRSEVGPETSLHALEKIGLEKSQVLDGLGNARRQLAFESSPLSSATGRFFSTNTGRAMAMALSSDGNTAFLCTILGEYFSLNIVNISNMESPSLLGSIPLTLAEDNNITNDYSDSVLSQMTMLLSPDEQTVLMSTGPTIEIFNVSNLTSPFSVHSYIPVEGNITITSFVLMSDGKSLAITIRHYDVQDDEDTVYLIIANITNLLDPTVIYNSEETSSEVSDNEVYFDQGVLWVGSDTYWKTFNTSNLAQPQYIATLNASIPYGVSISTFSPDYRTIYICYHGYNSDDSDNSDFSDVNYCNIFDIANMSNLTQYPTTISISISVDSSAQTLAITPDNRHLFITGGDFLQVFDVSNLSSPVQVNNISIPFPNQIVISADGRRALVSTSLQVYSVELYFNVPVSQFYNLQNSLIGILNPPTKPGEVVDSIALSSDGNTLYVAECLDERFGGPSASNLEIFNVSDPNSINLISDVGFNLSINQIRLSPDGDSLVVAFEGFDGEASDSSNSDGYSAYSVIEINSTESGESLSSFSFPNSVESFTLSPDGKTLFAYYANWTIINITNLTSPSQIGYYSFDPGDTFIGMTISSDGNTAFFTGSFLRIVNISDLESPTLISNYTLNSANHDIISITISPDNQTAFLTTRMDGGGSYFLEIVNISSLPTPSFISSMSIPDDSDYFQDSDHNAILPNDAQLANISPDGKTLFVVASGLAILNVSNLADPSFLGYYSASETSSLQISPDYSTAFLAHFSQGVIVLNLKSSYIFDMPVTAFPLGKTGSGTLNVLTINSNKTYDAKLMNYKFIGLSLYGLDYEPGYASPLHNYTALPNWMDFDTSTGILTVSPYSDSQVGSYTLYGALSTYIEEDVFLGVANTSTIKEATQLMTTLIGLGYIDNQGFLTSAFDPNTPLKIVSRALPNETEIRNVMSNYYIEAMISITVIPSLSLTLGDQSSVDPKISINTLSLSPLSLQIKLENTNNIIAKFVDTDYSLIPSFSLDYTTISVVGSLLDINLVLSQFVIFVNSTTPCNGTITVSDGLNSPLTESITNISAYFSKSSQPLYNPSYFQSQIDKVSIVTGDQFIIQFDYDTFQDSDGEDLTYTLAAQDSNAQVPDWVTLRGLDLIGTPPLQLNDRDIPLKIIASNQYQSVEANFTIHVGISWAFALKLVLEYGSGLITVLGLIIYINHIYNILCKRLYRYPIEFTAKVGEEITSRTIYPLAFIREASLESRFILKKLDKKIAAEIKNSSKSEIANYFRLENNYQIDKANLTQCIEQVVIELLSTKDSDKLRLYVPGINSRKELIEQLIITEMTIRLIDMKEQSHTKQAFKNIKNNLFKLIELKKHSKDGICDFCVVRSKLYEHLQIKNIQISPSIKNNESKTEILNESTQETPASIHSPLHASKPQGVNVDLLVDIIEAYTFKYHNIDADLLDIKVQVKEKAKHVSRPRAIRRFFKMDLIEVNFVSDKRQLGYGLQYETRKGFLRFYGEPDYDIKDRTLAIQITNVKGRILREIWVNGVGNETERESLRESLIL